MKKNSSAKLGVLIAALIIFFSAFSAEAQWSLSSVASTGLPSGTVYGIIEGILDWLLMIIGVLGIIGFLISGAMYILSSGDDKLAGRAKTAMTNSIIGIIVALSGFVVIRAIDSILGGWGDF